MSGTFSLKSTDMKLVYKLCELWWVSPAVHHFPRVFLSVYFCFAGHICAHVQFFGNIKTNASRLCSKKSPQSKLKQKYRVRVKYTVRIYLDGGIRVRILQELDVVAFWPWNLNVVAFCSLKKHLGITMSWLICLRFSMSWLFGLGISISWFFGLGISMSWLFALESRCRGICASTALFSYSLNLLCHIINVNM